MYYSDDMHLICLDEIVMAEVVNYDDSSGLRVVFNGWSEHFTYPDKESCQAAFDAIRKKLCQETT